MQKKMRIWFCAMVDTAVLGHFSAVLIIERHSVLTTFGNLMDWRLVIWWFVRLAFFMNLSQAKEICVVTKYYNLNCDYNYVEQVLNVLHYNYSYCNIDKIKLLS